MITVQHHDKANVHYARYHRKEFQISRTTFQPLLIFVKINSAHLLEEILQDGLLTSLATVNFDRWDKRHFWLEQIGVLASQSVKLSALFTGGASFDLGERDIVGVGAGLRDRGRVVVVVDHALDHAQLVPLLFHIPANNFVGLVNIQGGVCIQWTLE